eukprot:768525-Hanusia_phi.AAC.5
MALGEAASAGPLVEAAGQQRAAACPAAKVKLQGPGEGAVGPGLVRGRAHRLRHPVVEGHRAREALHLLHLGPPAGLQQPARRGGGGGGALVGLLPPGAVVEEGGGERAIGQELPHPGHGVAVGRGQGVGAVVEVAAPCAGQPVEEVEEDQGELADVVPVDEHPAVEVDLVPQGAVGQRVALHHHVQVDVAQRPGPRRGVPPEPPEERQGDEQRLRPLPRGAHEVGPADEHVGRDVVPESELSRSVPGGGEAGGAGGEHAGGPVVLPQRVPGVHAGVVQAVEVGGPLLGEEPAAVGAAAPRGRHPAHPQGHEHGGVAEGRAVDAVAVHVGRVRVVAGGGEEVAVADRVHGRGGGRVPAHGGSGLRQAQPGQLVLHLLAHLGHRAGLRGDPGEEAGAHPVRLAGLDDAHGLAGALGAGDVAERRLHLGVHEGAGGVGLVDALLVRHAGRLQRLGDVAEALLADGVAAEAVHRVHVLAEGARVADDRVGVAGGLRAEARVRGGAGHLAPRAGDAGDVARPAAGGGRQGARPGRRVVGGPDVAAGHRPGGAVERQHRDPLERADADEAGVVDPLEHVADGQPHAADEVQHGADDGEEEVLHEPVQQGAQGLDDEHELAPKGSGLDHAEQHVAELVEEDLGLVDEHVEPLHHRGHDLVGALAHEEAEEVDAHHRQVVGKLHQRLHDGAELGQQGLHRDQPLGGALLLHLVVLLDDGGDLLGRLRGGAGLAVHGLVEVQDCLCHELLVGDAVRGRVVQELRLHADPGRLAVGLLDALQEVGHPDAELVHGGVEGADAYGDHRRPRGGVVEDRGATGPEAPGGVQPLGLGHRAEALPAVGPRRLVARRLGAVGPVPGPESGVVHLGGRRQDVTGGSPSRGEEAGRPLEVAGQKAVHSPLPPVDDLVQQGAGRLVAAHLLPEVTGHHPRQRQAHGHAEAGVLAVEVGLRLIPAVLPVDEVARGWGLVAHPAAAPVVGGVGHLARVRGGGGDVQAVVAHRGGRAFQESRDGALEVRVVEPPALPPVGDGGRHPHHRAHVALPARVQGGLAGVRGDRHGNVAQLEPAEAVVVGALARRLPPQGAPVPQRAPRVRP